MGMRLWRNLYAVFYNSNGSLVGKKKFKKTDKTVDYEGRTYIVKTDEWVNYFRYEGVFADSDYYFYDLDNPLPIQTIVNPQFKPIIDSKAVNGIFKSKLIEEVSSVNESLLSKLLTPRNIFIMLIVGVAIFYFANGGTIS